MEDINKFEEQNNEETDIEVINGDGKNLDISPVYDHIKLDKPDSNNKKDTNIVVPKANK